MAEQIIQSVKKRVVCLYRVSSVGQVDKDDIPMQKQYCREFCKRNPRPCLKNKYCTNDKEV